MNFQPLIDLIGQKAFNALKSGKAYLYIWNGTYPSNWYIAGKRDTGMHLWHSSTCKEEGPRVLPNLRFFELHSVDGPQERTYRLKGAPA